MAGHRTHFSQGALNKALPRRAKLAMLSSVPPSPVLTQSDTPYNLLPEMRPRRWIEGVISLAESWGE